MLPCRKLLLHTLLYSEVLLFEVLHVKMLQSDYNKNYVVSVKIILDKRKSKKDGTYPLYFQIRFHRKTTTRSTKIAINEIDWDDNKKEITKSHPESKF